MSVFPLLYFATAVVVGLLGIGRWGGFLLYFIAALVFSPILTVLFLILITPRAKRRTPKLADDDRIEDPR